MSSAIEPVIEPAIVLAAYAEPLASGRRVLFVGPASSALPARLLERGARVVLVCDPDPVRLAEATAKNRSSALSFSALADGQLALRDGAFDVAIVEDAGISDPLALVKRLRRALTTRGVAILASANPDARAPLLPPRAGGTISLDYYALYDAVKTEFEHVRMLGQAPFVGYVVADFAPEGTPEPSLDTAFLPNGAEEPEIFVAVASHQPVELEAFAVVQLPYRSVVSGAPSDGDALRRARQAETAARGKLEEVEGELASGRQLLIAREAELQAERKATAARSAELAAERKTSAARAADLATERQASAARAAELATERQANAARAAELATERQANAARAAELATERQANAARATELATERQANAARATELTTERQASAARATELTAERQASAARDAKLREAETRVFARDAELTALRRELENKNRQLEAQEGKLSELDQKLAQAPSAEEAGAAAADLGALEQALAERGEHVRKLERELREAERIGKELLRQLPPAADPSPAARLVVENELAQKLAKTQADLVATRWALEAAVKRGAVADAPES